MLNRHTRDNLLLVGDAAGLADPLMGYGMLPAIVSGYYAGKYSVEAIKNPSLKKKALAKRYEDEIRKKKFVPLKKLHSSSANGPNVV
jgi:flavin-dependent dehydrogenase